LTFQLHHITRCSYYNQLIAENNTFGKAINDTVHKFYILYDPEDDGLKVNQLGDNHSPLGLVGAPNGTAFLNYNDTNVAYEIPPFSDADGDGIILKAAEHYL
jgi:hypothetical protein